MNNSLLAVQYVIRFTKTSDGLVSGEGTLSGPPQELFDFIASDGSDLRLETGDRIQIDIRGVRRRDADFVVIGDFIDGS